MKRLQPFLTLFVPVLLLSLLLIGFVAAGFAPLYASEEIPAGAPTSLDVAAVGSPNINCRFAVSCIWYVEWDFLDEVPLKGTNGGGWLQTRLTRKGESGTAAEGLYPYLYGFNFYELEITTPPVECITGFTIPFGDIAPVDYDEDGEPDDLFVIQGGDSYLSEAVRLPTGEISITYSTPICPDVPATQLGSLFVGLASTQPYMMLDAGIHVDGGDPYLVETLVSATSRIHLPMVNRQ